MDHFPLLFQPFSLGVPPLLKGSPVGSDSKESSGNVGDPGLISGLIPGLGRSPGEGNAYPPSIFAQRIPWTEEPDGLQSTGSELDTTKQLTLFFSIYFY